MWNIPTQQRLAEIPRLYATEHISLQDKLIHLHFFIFGCDWFVSEFDGQDTFWGFTILGNDYLNAEWGYFSFTELKQVNVRGIEIDCELEEFWQIRPASQVGKITHAQGWHISV